MPSALWDGVTNRDRRVRREQMLAGEGDAWLRRIAAWVGARPDPTDKT